jgi:hypothetical protein
MKERAMVHYPTEVLGDLSGRIDLAGRVETCVLRRTGGLVSQLRVDVFGREVVLSGRAVSYYGKQLATHGALDAVQDTTVTNDIEVY